MLKRQALQILESKIRACNKCEELSQYRAENNYQHVPGNGSPLTRLMAVGEAPGENEAKSGVPFCGKAGNLLNNIFRAAGWSRDDVFVANAIKCRPPGNRDPSGCEMANCRKFLDLQIRAVAPEWIICFGRVASIAVLGLDEFATLSSVRYKVHDRNGIKVVCTYHPSYVQHQSDNPRRMAEAKDDIWRDIQPVISALQQRPGPV